MRNKNSVSDKSKPSIEDRLAKLEAEMEAVLPTLGKLITVLVEAGIIQVEVTEDK